MNFLHVPVTFVQNVTVHVHAGVVTQCTRIYVVWFDVWHSVSYKNPKKYWPNAKLIGC